MGRPIGTASVGRTACRTCQGKGQGKSGKDCRRCDEAYKRAIVKLCDRFEAVADEFNVPASDVNADLAYAYMSGVPGQGA